jgi:hypothetical protein
LFLMAYFQILLFLSSLPASELEPNGDHSQ